MVAQGDGLTFEYMYTAYYLSDEGMVAIESATGLPLNIVLINILLYYGRIASLVLFIIGGILSIGNLMKWRLTLLWKQILFTIPVVVVMIFMFTDSFVNEYEEIFASDQADILIELNEIIMNDIDVEEMHILLITMEVNMDVHNTDLFL